MSADDFEWVGDFDGNTEINVKRTREPWATRIFWAFVFRAPWRLMGQIGAVLSAAIAGHLFDPNPDWIESTEQGVLLMGETASLSEFIAPPIFAALSISLLIVSTEVLSR